MPPTAKEFDAITPSSEKAAERPAATGGQTDDAGRPQPVPLEVPVSVNGARTVEGSDKREPFSEATQTVLVFATGAVIRLASMVAPGQLLFLTNDKTKKEVVCQVVKSKNYRNVSGYVELEFTEAVAGFWGMRFPGERTAAQPGAPAAKSQAPAANSTPRPTESKPAQVPPAPIRSTQPNLAQARSDASATQKREAPVAQATEVPQAKAPIPTTSAPKTEIKLPPPVNLPRVTDTQTITALPKTTAPADALGLGITSLPRTPEVKPAPPVANQPKPVTPISQGSTESLKLESARLQEQLSSMLFSAPPTTQPAAAPPATNKTAAADMASKVLDISKIDAARTKTAPPAKATPFKVESALDGEEVKIPSWLEPLARNVGTSTANDVPAKDEDARIDEAHQFQVQDVSAPAVAKETGAAVSAESAFNDSLLPETHIAPDKARAGSNKGILIGAVAAGVLVLIAGITWYSRRPASPAQSATNAASAQAVAVTSAVQPPTQNAQGSQAKPTASIAAITPAATPPSATPSQTSTQPAPLAAETVKASSKQTTAELLAFKKLAEPRPQPAVEPQAQSKKPSLGQVRLATPNVKRGGTSQASGEGESAPALSATQGSPAGDTLGGGLVVENTKQPTAPPAPLPVGGDVKAAHMISSVAPIYPALAKSQHIEGDVRVDALIDPNGRVSAMKVVSGPVLLHQAAMDALRQWKYQPATLDGKAVPMHLTVTIQFRLQ